MRLKIYLPLFAASALLATWLYSPLNKNSVTPLNPLPGRLTSQPLSLEVTLQAVTDALPTPLPKNLVEIETAAGKLICTSGLCRTTVEYVPQPEDGPPLSEHLVRLKDGAPEMTLGCAEGASTDPGCQIDGRDVSGGKFYVLGDGCVYVRQYWNAYFPLTKKYCLSKNNNLYRVHQALYPVGLKSIAFEDLPLVISKTNQTLAGKTLKGETYTVEAAEVNEFDDFYAEPNWFVIRDLHGNIGWVPKSRVVNPHCDPTNEKAICFHGD